MTLAGFSFQFLSALYLHEHYSASRLAAIIVIVAGIAWLRVSLIMRTSRPWLVAAIAIEALAPLLAESLVSEILGEPSPLGAAARHAAHPARFLVRALKRGEDLTP